jgi:hypothetical protein
LLAPALPQSGQSGQTGNTRYPTESRAHPSVYGKYDARRQVSVTRALP